MARNVRNAAGRIAAAIRFLTIIPLPGNAGTGEDELAGSLLFFPFVGMMIGVVVLFMAVILQWLLPSFVCAVLLTCLLAACSGGLHLDGLADTADGFFSSRPRERILEIMRDSATGVMGSITLVFLLLIKVSCLDSLATDGMLLPAVFLMPLAGRTTIVLLMALQPYAREQGGLATLFYSQISRRAALFALAVFAIFSVCFAGVRGFAVVVASSLLVIAFGFYCRRKIGGSTGDTLGAVCELAEAVTALVFVLQPGGGL
ncbi:MAG: adenosylcobinamide-GDP ribazoletransferase [Desulfobulbus sp.]|nr:MAG: adenosylcobinamide-GDP ribazoletransferase [Desulfobulbus sp.]